MLQFELETIMKTYAQIDELLDCLARKYARGTIGVDDYTENLCSILIALNTVRGE